MSIPVCIILVAMLVSDLCSDINILHQKHPQLLRVFLCAMCIVSGVFCDLYPVDNVMVELLLF